MPLLATVAAFLFSSGLCALVYQSVWLRAFRLIFGASTPSTAAVLAIFLGGLGIGGAYFGRRVERTRFPLMLYGTLEIAVALTAACTPLLLWLAERAYQAMGGTPTLGTAGATVVRLLLATLVLGAPVFLMGGTLPAAARAVTTAQDGARRGMAALYGANTLGAVCGALLATFLLLEVYGARMTLWLACLLNVGIGVLARSRGRRVERLPHLDDALSARMRTRRTAVLLAAFLTGFVFLLAEIVWYRMASPILGGSAYGFGLVLACALLGVGVGGALYAWVPPKLPSASLFAATCALEALLLLVPFAMGDNLALLAMHLRSWGVWSFPLLVAGWSGITALLVLPASTVAGYQFPLMLALKGSADVDVGRDSGELYAANTAGSIAGSLAGGFGILPALGATGAWRLAALLLVAVALALLVRGPRTRLASTVAVLGVLLTLWCASARGPGHLWRHSAIGAGRAPAAAQSKNGQRQIEHELELAITHDEDGVESNLAFSRGLGWSLLQNGKSDGNTYADAATQVGLSLLPALLADNVERAFIIGLGTGQSAGWLAQLPGVQHVEVAEIEPGVLGFAQQVADTNYDVLHQAKVHVQLGDGRELLALAPQPFDLIVSEPSNPYRAGVSSFFSRELYQAASARLRPGGLFAQWVQGYEIDVAGMEVITATMATAFSDITVWEVGPNDLLFLASNAPQTVDVARVRARLQQDPWRRWALHIAGIHSAEAVLGLMLADADTTRAIAAAHTDTLHTDDLPLLEYSFARSVGAALKPARQVMADASEARGGAHPRLLGSVDAATVGQRRARMHVWATLSDASTLPAIADAALRAYGAGRLSEAIALWRASPAPLDAYALTLLADAMSRSDAAVAPRDVLEATLNAMEGEDLATDAAWVRLRAALTDGRDEDVDALLGRAVELTRRDPWPVQRVLHGALLALKAAQPSDARIALLHKPFAGGIASRTRLDVLLALEWRAMRPTPRKGCDATMALLEPSPPWNVDALRLRASCYAMSGSPLAAAAQGDVDRFIEDEPRQQMELRAP